MVRVGVEAKPAEEPPIQDQSDRELVQGTLEDLSDLRWGLRWGRLATEVGPRDTVGELIGSIYEGVEELGKRLERARNGTSIPVEPQGKS